MQHHKLIYGFYVDDTDTKPIKPFQKYSLGGSDSGDGGDGGDYIGFEYDRVIGIFNNYQYVYDGKLQFSTGKVPQQIIDLFKEKYPEKEATCYALIQDVPTYHYCYGFIMYGYWINIDADQYISDILWDLCYKSNTFKTDLKILQAGDNLQKVPGEYFCGVNIEEFTSTEASDPESCEELAIQLCKSYEPFLNIAPKDIIIKELFSTILTKTDLTQESLQKIKFSYLPVLTFVQAMCYCCT